MKRRELTICTVTTPLHRELLRLNVELTRALNPDLKVHWRVVDYSWIHTRKKLQKKFAEEIQSAESSFGKLGEEVTLLPAPPREEIDAYLDERIPHGIRDKERERLIDKYTGSYTHGLALRRCLNGVDTRFVLVLDPDFYVVRNNWGVDVLGHMERNQLGFFGVPWHPRWFQKFRDFPCVHCLFIDGEKVPYTGEDFLPDLIEDQNPSSDFWIDTVHQFSRMKRKDRLRYLLSHAKQAIAEDRVQRASIGRSRDTGWRLKEKYAGKVPHELAFAGYLPLEDALRPRSVLRLQSRRAVERFLPPEMRYQPARETYTTLEFRHFFVADARSRDWEEFFWRGMPFGFHVRGENQRSQRGVVFDPKLPEILDRFKRVAALSTEVLEGRAP